MRSLSVAETQEGAWPFASGEELLSGLPGMLSGEGAKKERLSKVANRLLREVGRLSAEWALIEPNDRIMAAVSGGKDSYGMVALLLELRRRTPFPFEIIAVNLDQGHPGFPGHLISGWLESQGVPYRMLKQDTYSIVKEKVEPGKTTCSLCSRLRRGILYNAAQELGCTKIALGHHRDDLIETLLLNQFFAGQIKTMPPRLRSDDGRNVVIRPLASCAEADLAAFAEERNFPIIPCDLCGSQENLQRKKVKALIAELSRENPKVPGNLYASLARVRPSHLLDRDLLGLVGEGMGNDEHLP
jgi:tRNA 2-thiocytidine biosynthesis protein TtcA